MSRPEAAPWPDGYKVLRMLAEASSGVVCLALSPQSKIVALKLMRIRPGANADEVVARHRRLQRLTRARELLTIRGCGLSRDRAWLWEELDPVESADGSPASIIDSYIPATLRLCVIEGGPLTTRQAIQAGQTVARALARLHAEGLVHRDVKPGNLFRVAGGVVLGDYGLVGPPGSPFDFSGTEGFVPSEGNAGAGTDLFALGKTLYEIWTGCDRLEFPTIPKPLLTHPDWARLGAGLNQVLLKACSHQAGQRYRNTDELLSDLEDVAAGGSLRTTRRRWLRMGIAAGTLALTAGLVHHVRSRTIASWRKRHHWTHLPHGWGGGRTILDERRTVVYHFNNSETESVLHTTHLDSFESTRLEFEVPFRAPSSALLHPEERTLWFAENGRGPMYRLDPISGRVQPLGGSGAAARTSFGGLPYWNPDTARFGTFGGYGLMRVHNFRWEFDLENGEWIEVEENEPGREPWCRIGVLLAPFDNGQRLVLFGGGGNSTGRQGGRDEGFQYWDSRWHPLGDVWTLDLSTGKWDCRLPLPGLELPNPSAACLVGELLVVGHQRAPGEAFGTSPQVFLLNLSGREPFEEVECVGDVPDGRGELFLSRSVDDASFLAFHPSGVYEVTLDSPLLT